MKKSAVKLGVVVTVVLAGVMSIVIFAATIIPVNVVATDLQHKMGFSPLGDSRLSGGQGMVTGRTGTDIVTWRWCPDEGLAAFCFTLSGNSGYLTGVLAVGLGHFEVGKLSLSRLRPDAMGIGGLPKETFLRGDLGTIRWPWGDNCPHHGLATLEGDVVLGDPSGAEYMISLKGDGEQGILLSGDFVNGSLDLGGNRITGKVVVAYGESSGSALNISRQFDCGR